MKYFLLSILCSLVSAQTTVDPQVLLLIFGAEPNRDVGETRDTISATPTDPVGPLAQSNPQNCQCVPFYFCDANNFAINVNNADVTGYGELDVRFGDDDERPCQESVEVCCTISTEVVSTRLKPQPDPSKVKGCGYRNPNGLGATFTYANSQFGEFPWVVVLLDSRTQDYLGVGTLINPEVVLTAAHVAVKSSPGVLKIRAGEWDTQTDNEIYEYQERIVKEIYIHNEFNKQGHHSNNIALLRLASPLQFTEHINAICLPEQDEVFDSHTNCIANGWGKNLFGAKGHFSVILKKVELNIIPYSRCSNLLRRTRLGYKFRLHDSFICAGGKEGEDTCEGDGGAPLACPIGDNRYKLTGLVSWGIGCGMKDVPGVYANVPSFRQWVDKKLENWGLSKTSYKL